MKKYSRWCFTVALGLLTACQKDSDLLVVESKLTDQNTLATFVAVHGAPKQLFTLAAALDSFQFKTAQGNKLVIPANAFVLPNGMRPSSIAPIEVEFREIMSKPDMVLSARPTVSNNQLLESSGEFYLKAKQGANALRLNPAAKLRLRFQNSRPSSYSNMALFYGTTIKDEFTWLPQSSADVSSSIVQDSLPSQPRYYRMLLNNDSLGWVSSAHLVNRTPQTTVRISISGEEVQTNNTMVFLVFKSLNTVVRAFPQSSDNTFSAPNIPEGLQATALVLRNVNGAYFFGQQTVQIANNQLFTPNVTAMSEAAIVTAIQKL